MDGNSRALYNQYNGIANFLPRVGLAWTPGKKTVIRAAFGRTSFQEGTGEYNRLATNAPWNVDLVGQSVAAERRDSSESDYARSGLRRPGLGTGGCTVANVTSCSGGMFRRRSPSRHRSQLPAGGLQSMEFFHTASVRQLHHDCRRLISASTPIIWRISCSRIRKCCCRTGLPSPVRTFRRTRRSKTRSDRPG